MSRVQRPTPNQFIERSGILIQKETGDSVISCLIASDRRTKNWCAGFFEGLLEGFLRAGWFRCEIDPEVLSFHAKSILTDDGWTQTPLVVTEVRNHDIVFTQIENEGEKEWFAVGVLEYGSPPKGHSFPMRWVRITPPTPDILSALQGYAPRANMPNAESKSNPLLRRIAEWSGTIKHVQCLVTLNVKEGVYRIDLLYSGKPIARRESSDTQEILDFLRSPFRTGEYPTAKDGSYLKWDYLNDVEYDDIRIETHDGKKEWLSLSFLKPLVHRSTFFEGSFPVPERSQKVLASTLAGDATLSVHFDERLKGVGASKFLKISLEGVPDDSLLKNLESERMNIYDLALLAECKQLIDTRNSKRYDIGLDVQALLDLDLNQDLSEFKRLDNELIGLIESMQDAEHIPSKTPVEQSGPPLKLVELSVETVSRGTLVEARAVLANVGDDYDLRDVTIYSVSKEVLKTQALSREFLGLEVEENLASYRIDEATIEDIRSEVEEELAKFGARFSDD